MADSKINQVHVIFDTNAIYVDDLKTVTYRVSQLIEASRSFKHITVAWFIPSMVRMERRYRMLEQASSLLRDATKLDKALGRKPSYTQQSLEKQLDRLIDGELSSFGIKLINLKTNKVSWKTLIEDSAMRRPPFSQSQGQDDSKETEKGFRDAIIQQEILQYLSVTEPAESRQIILLTDDKLLADSTNNKVKGRKDFTVIKTVADLTSHLTRLESQLEEGFIETVTKASANFLTNEFWDEHSEEFDNLLERIEDKLAAVPEDGYDITELIYLPGPTAVEKYEESILTFTSTIFCQVDAVKSEQVLDYPRPTTKLGQVSPKRIDPRRGLSLNRNLQVSPPSAGSAYSSTGGTVGGLGGLGGIKVPNFELSLRTIQVHQRGFHELQLRWQAKWIDNHLNDPKIESLSYVGVTWGPTEE